MASQKSPIGHNCGFCGKPAWFEAVSSLEDSGEQIPRYSRPYDSETLVAALYRCSGCSKCSIFYFTAPTNLRDDFNLELVLPGARASRNESLPAGIEGDRQEAWNCFHHGQYRGSILMARTTLQRAARHLHTFSEKRTTLEFELDTLVEKGIINQDLRDNADEVRITGNEVAHPAEMGEITKEDAEDSLVFLEGFLETTISVPARREKRKARREESPPA